MKEIFHRVSVRKYTDQIVEDEKIERILQAAFRAPTAKNQQAWHFYVIRNKDKLKELSKATPYSMCVKNASVAIVVCYEKSSLAEEFVQIDCAIATENILLEVDHLGLGAVMIGVAPNRENMENVERILNISDNQHAFTIIPIGYPEREKEIQDRYNKDKIHYID